MEGVDPVPGEQGRDDMAAEDPLHDRPEKRLRLLRPLANALLEDLQQGTGSGWIGARDGFPCSIYPAGAGQWTEVESLLRSRGEELFGHYGNIRHPCQPDLWHLELDEAEKGVLTLSARECPGGEIRNILLIHE